MKIAIAQINTTVGDFKGNTAKIIDRIAWAKKNGADIVAFPEMSVTGYPPKDLLDQPHFITKNIESVQEIAKHTNSQTAAIVGFISMNEATTGKGLFNSAAFIHDGKIQYVQMKALLPTYDVFDEGRYFEPGKNFDVVTFKHKKIGITICEDIWSTAEFYGRKLYTVDPVNMLAEKGAQFIINISASPFMTEKHKLRETLLTNVAKQHNMPLVYVNLVGGNDELVFDGRSMVVNKNGKVVIEGGAFVEDAIIVDVNNLPEEPQVKKLGEVNEIYEALVIGTRDYIHKCYFEKVVIGLSGGIDSALVACVAAEAIGPQNVMCLSMPTRYSSTESVEYARKLANNLGVRFEKIDIDEIYQKYLDILKSHFAGSPEDTTEENIQARVRGNTLMAFSNKFNAMVLSTGNKSELAVGYCTLYGDLAGGLGVISDVPKTMVYKLAEFINKDKEIIPRFIIDRPPTAELKPDQKDQDVLPPYEILDSILKAYIEDHLSVTSIIDMGYDRSVVEDVTGMVARSEYKRRQAPPGLKVTSKAFGWGRRYPIARK